MKNLNLIKRLWTDSHEKQSPQRFARYAAMLIMLLALGVGQMWAATSSTFYFAISAATIEGECNNVKFCVKYGDSEWSGDQTMTKQNATFNGKLVYKATYSFAYGGYYNWQFMNGTSLYREIYAGSWNSTLHSGQVYDYDTQTWSTYSADASYTIYFVNNDSWASPKAYAWNPYSSGTCDFNASWAGSAMTSTGKTNNGKTIYKLDLSKRYANVIFSNNGSNQTSDLTLGTTYANKMYNSGWGALAHDVTLDQQSATTDGTTSIIATPGSAKPSIASLPTRTGYDFGGYYTSSGGGGTQYYNASGTATSGNWPAFASSPTTLYAKWTKKTYTVTVNNDGHGTTSPSGAQSSIAQVDGIAISADADDNYEFVNWTIESGTGSFTDATDASTTFYPTSAATIQANFRSTLTYSLTVAAGSNVGTVTGSTDPVTLGNSYAISASNFTSGYEFNNWTASPAANATFASSTSASTNVTVKNGSVTVTANAREIMRTITISGGTAASTTAGVATQGTATAAEPAAGKKFTGWTLGTGVSLAGGYALTDRTIKFTATQASSVTANYADRAGVKVYFAKPSGWSTAYVYAWKSSDDSKKNATWPGEAMASTETINYITYYTYQYYTEADGIGGGATGNSEWNSIKFTDNGDETNRTADLAIADGHYYFSSSAESGTGKATAPTSAWCIKGDWNSWSEDADQITHSAAATGSKSITLTTGNKEFKIYNIVEQTWWRFSGNVTATKSATTMDNSDGNMTITPSVAGPYTFALSYLTGIPKLAITYPATYTVTFSAETFENGDASHSTSTTGGTLSAVDGHSAALSSGGKVISGGSAVITASKKTGYSFIGFYTNAACSTAVSGTGVSISDNVLTLSSITANKTVYAKFSENMTAITITTDGHGTITSPNPNNSPYNLGVATTKSINASANAGYHWNRWTTSGNAALGTTETTANNTVKGNGTSGGTGTVTATFTANTWYVRFNRNGGTGGSDMANESFTYDAAAKALTTNTYTRSGYEFSGWATSQANADAGIVAYADKATVRNLTTTSNGIVNLFAVWTANTYTVDFDVNGGTASTPDDKEVTFGSAYGTLPSGMTHTSKTFVGWYTDADDGEGDLITAETIVSTASDHTLYAHYENVYSVNVNFKSGTATIYPATSVTASPTSLAPTITAPEIFGYTFVNWTGSNATFGNASSATTTVKATAATTVTANYNVVPTVYFKNNLGWDSVFVSFDIAWKEVDGKNVPSNKTKPYYKMTQIGTTDIYYCEIPSTYTSSNYASWSANIAFDNTNYGRHATSDHIGTWDFYGGEFTGRGDFDPKTTLFIPYDGDIETRNNGTFYKTGCWMKYNSTESGYQVNMNTWVTGTHDDTLTVALNAANAGGYEFSAKLNLKHADYSYGFKLYKIYQKSANDIWYTNCPATITAATDDLPWHFWAGESITATSERCALHTEALGDYTITVSFATGRPEVNVIYPASVGDWRLAYNDRIAWSGDIHGAGWYLYSRVIKAKADAEDLVSFYVSKAVGANAHIELQKCTAIDAGTGAETWTKQGDNLDLSSITGTGIYNFKVTQNGSKVATAAYDGAYDGNFYIRTDASDGGWNNYISSGKNLMTYSEYAEDNSGFTHYYMRYVTTGSNIKFCIANDYSECLTEYCVSDDFTNEYIEANGNVRFMWDHRTNAVSRAYISGSSVVSDRFLVLEGDEKLFNESGQALTTAGGGKVSGLNDNEMNFIDDQNWIYEATVKAQPKAKVKLTAKYNNQIQYFYGDEGDDAADSVLLLDGTGTDKYKMRIVYDFKTNRLLRAFIPDGEISAPMAINADMMIIREHQGDAQQVTFSGEGKLSAVKTVYGAMKFNKYTVNGKEKTGGHAGTGASRFERDLFYISFPFDVKLSDAFGFGTYGKHWIIEYYDGKGRAKNGFWADSEPNWKFVWPAQRSSFTMKAFEGYILALDLDEMSESSSVWDNGVEDVYVYFPSDGNVNNISATNRTITIDQEGYECKINRATPDGNRTVKDSYWHCIGVPSFANYSSALSPTSGGETIDWSDADGEIDWSTPNLPYLYVWNSGDNSLSVTRSATFNFKATWSYLVQYAGTSIYWSQVNVTPASIVARERTAPTNTEFRIELQQGGEKADQTFVRLTEEEHVTTGFDFNYDLSKEYNRNRANIYTMVTTVKEGVASVTQSAANVLPMSDQTTVVPVGVKIATTGDYTFAIPEGTAGVGVTLIDNETGIRTSLSALNYTINLSAGTYENRFVLEISPIKQMPTDIESVSDQHSAVRKVMIDGVLYIVKDGKVFDAHGNRVK